MPNPNVDALLATQPQAVATPFSHDALAILMHHRDPFVAGVQLQDHQDQIFVLAGPEDLRALLLKLNIRQRMAENFEYYILVRHYAHTMALYLHNDANSIRAFFFDPQARSESFTPTECILKVLQEQLSENATIYLSATEVQRPEEHEGCAVYSMQFLQYCYTKKAEIFVHHTQDAVLLEKNDHIAALYQCPYDSSLHKQLTQASATTYRIYYHGVLEILLTQLYQTALKELDRNKICEIIQVKQGGNLPHNSSTLLYEISCDKKERSVHIRLGQQAEYQNGLRYSLQIYSDHILPQQIMTVVPEGFIAYYDDASGVLTYQANPSTSLESLPENLLLQSEQLYRAGMQQSAMLKYLAANLQAVFAEKNHFTNPHDQPSRAIVLPQPITGTNFDEIKQICLHTNWVRKQKVTDLANIISRSEPPFRSTLALFFFLQCSYKKHQQSLFYLAVTSHLDDHDRLVFLKECVENMLDNNYLKVVSVNPTLPPENIKRQTVWEHFILFTFKIYFTLSNEEQAILNDYLDLYVKCWGQGDITLMLKQIIKHLSDDEKSLALQIVVRNLRKANNCDDDSLLRNICLFVKDTPKEQRWEVLKSYLTTLSKEEQETVKSLFRCEILNCLDSMSVRDGEFRSPQRYVNEKRMLDIFDQDGKLEIIETCNVSLFQVFFYATARGDISLLNYVYNRCSNSGSENAGYSPETLLNLKAHLGYRHFGTFQGSLFSQPLFFAYSYAEPHVIESLLTKIQECGLDSQLYVTKKMSEEIVTYSQKTISWLDWFFLFFFDLSILSFFQIMFIECRPYSSQSLAWIWSKLENDNIATTTLTMDNWRSLRLSIERTSVDKYLFAIEKAQQLALLIPREFNNSTLWLMLLWSALRNKDICKKDLNQHYSYLEKLLEFFSDQPRLDTLKQLLLATNRLGCIYPVDTVTWLWSMAYQYRSCDQFCTLDVNTAVTPTEELFNGHEEWSNPALLARQQHAIEVVKWRFLNQADEQSSSSSKERIDLSRLSIFTFWKSPAASLPQPILASVQPFWG